MRKKYDLNKGNLQASMVVTPEGYLVIAGSEVSMTQTHCLSKGCKDHRSNLLEKGLVKLEGSKWILKEDVLFPSASAAASSLVGYQCGGPVSWKDKDGKTLKENQKSNKKTLSRVV